MQIYIKDIESYPYVHLIFYTYYIITRNCYTYRNVSEKKEA